MSEPLRDLVTDRVVSWEAAARLRGADAAARAREAVTPRRLALAGALLLAFFVPFTAGVVQGEEPASPAAVLEPPATGAAPTPPALRAVPALPKPPAVVRRRPRPVVAAPVATPAPVTTPEPVVEPAPAPVVSDPAPPAPAPAPEPPPQTFDSSG